MGAARVAQEIAKGSYPTAHFKVGKKWEVGEVAAIIGQEIAYFGRIHVKRALREQAGYLAKYLSKERPECLKRWRLWAGFGAGWEWTKVKDVMRETLFSTIYRACKEWKQWQGRGRFFERMNLVRQMMFLTIENNWLPGRGPRSLPYAAFEENDFWFA